MSEQRIRFWWLGCKDNCSDMTVGQVEERAVNDMRFLLSELTATRKGRDALKEALSDLVDRVERCKRARKMPEVILDWSILDTTVAAAALSEEGENDG